MPSSVLYMSMPLDGHIAGPNDEPDNPGGDGFMRLHDWYGFKSTPPNTQGAGWGAHFMDEINATGAVLASHIEWEVIRVIETKEATHIRYRVRRE